MKKSTTIFRKALSLVLALMLVLPNCSIALAQENTEQQSRKSRIGDIFLEDDSNKTGVTSGNIYIPADTAFEIKLMQQASSKKCKEGDSIDFEVAENLIINGVIVIPQGEKVRAIVSKSRKAGGLGRKGKLEIDIQSVKTLNGISVPLSNDIEGKGKTDAGAAAVFAAVSVVGGLFMKGKNVVLNEGALFTVKVSKNVDLLVTNDNLAEAMSMSKPRGTEIIVGTAK